MTDRYLPITFSQRSTPMTQTIRKFLSILVILAGLIAVVPARMSVAQEVPPPKPVELACATNASAQVLSVGPVHEGAQNLVLVRMILGPGGSVGAHTHPGHLSVVVESGSLGFTLLDGGEMSITRAATVDSEATPEALVRDQQVALNPGDSFFEMGMVHSAENLSDGETTLLIAGLVEANQPLTSCVDTVALTK